MTSSDLTLRFGSGIGSGDVPYIDGVGSGDGISLIDVGLDNFNASFNSSEQREIVFRSSNWVIPVALAIGLLILGTICGNALVILSVLLVKRLRTPYNLLIVSLATTDLGIAALVMPLAALPELYGAWPLSNVFCDIFICLDMLFCTASILNLAAISLDRFLVITKPFQYGQRRTPRFMLLLVSISWGFSAAVSLPAVFGWRKERPVGECGYPEDLSFQLYATLVAFFLPTGLIIYVTFRIFFIVSKMAKADREANRSKGNEQTALVQSSIAPSSHVATGNSSNRSNKNNAELGLQLTHNQDHGPAGPQETSEAPGNAADSSANGLAAKHSGSPKSSNRPAAAGFRTRISKVLRPFGSTSSSSGNENREMKAVNTLGVFLGTFLLCWLPFFTMQLVNALRRCGSAHECVPPTLFGVLLWLGYAKSMCNPIINALYNRDIRRPFFEILRCRCRTLNSTLRNEAYADMYGRGSSAKPGAGGQDVKKSRSCSDAASTSAAAADVMRYEMTERSHH